MPIEPRFYPLDASDASALAAEAAAGLLGMPAKVAPKFLYDALGSRLFDAITELPSYYLTRVEREVMNGWLPAIAQRVLDATGPEPVLVDLGAGSCAKAARLFAALAPWRYVAVDIADDYLRQSLQALQRAHPAIEMVGVAQDFSLGLKLPDDLGAPRALVFYPGSSIGNFEPEAALRLLREARAAAGNGALLIGVDLVKDRAVLQAAYDDELGVTAAFNLNLLLHLNRRLGADFALRDWRHVARFDEGASRIEMHLQARQATRVSWPGGARSFAAGERIHTENSYKWTVAGFAALLRHAGFGRISHWTDDAAWFAVFVAEAGPA
ncbi:MAG TPA: L-histidine N(alpha)-methyltransferase [Burkholderiaceae bacterium]|nr:L-histidine N(alpha)-methyltransferase [Burkholderiaceae bacterium]